MVRRDEHVASKGVGFPLAFILLIIDFNVDVLLGVKQDVGGLMEEGEPELIVGPAAKAELQDGLFRADPLGNAPSAAALNIRNEDEGYAASGAGLLNR